MESHSTHEARSSEQVTNSSPESDVPVTTAHLRCLTAFKLGLVQMLVGKSKSDNVLKAVRLIKEAAAKGAQVVSLPECFNSPYGTQYFADYAEPVPGPTTEALASCAKECQIFLVAGSMPEQDGEKLYNTCTIFNPNGEIITKHRKVHLCDVHLPGMNAFQESSVLSPGDQLTSFKTPFCEIGVGICYDIRFAEMAQVFAQRGCKLLLYPSVFNMSSGPFHWEVIQRGRALDNQVYVAGAAPARDVEASYVAWGHSMVIDPWGSVIACTDEKESIVYADIDLNKVEEVRAMIPLTKQRRHDLYKEVTEV